VYYLHIVKPSFNELNVFLENDTRYYKKTDIPILTETWYDVAECVLQYSWLQYIFILLLIKRSENYELIILVK